jgi:hypothetical protein
MVDRLRSSLPMKEWDPPVSDTLDPATGGIVATA